MRTLVCGLAMLFGGVASAGVNDAELVVEGDAVVSPMVGSTTGLLTFRASTPIPFQTKKGLWMVLPDVGFRVGLPRGTIDSLVGVRFAGAVWRGPLRKEHEISDGERGSRDDYRFTLDAGPYVHFSSASLMTGMVNDLTIDGGGALELRGHRWWLVGVQLGTMHAFEFGAFDRYTLSVTGGGHVGVHF